MGNLYQFCAETVGTQKSVLFDFPPNDKERRIYFGEYGLDKHRSMFQLPFWVWPDYEAQYVIGSQ